jgi:hypothetical protein
MFLIFRMMTGLHFMHVPLFSNGEIIHNRRCQCPSPLFLLTQIIFAQNICPFRSLGSSVSIKTMSRAGQPGFCYRKGQWWYFSLRHCFQAGSDFHPVSYSKCTGEWSWPLTSIKWRSLRMRGVIPPLPNSSSWCYAYLSTGTLYIPTLECYCMLV